MEARRTEPDEPLSGTAGQLPLSEQAMKHAHEWDVAAFVPASSRGVLEETPLDMAAHCQSHWLAKSSRGTTHEDQYDQSVRLHAPVQRKRTICVEALRRLLERLIIGHSKQRVDQQQVQGELETGRTNSEVGHHNRTANANL